MRKQAAQQGWKWPSPGLPGWHWADWHSSYAQSGLRLAIAERLTEPLTVADPRPRVLEALAVAATIRDVYRLQVHHEVARRRAQGVTWQQIGSEFELSRQRAQQRFGHLPHRLKPAALAVFAEPSGRDLLVAMMAALGRLDCRTDRPRELGVMVELLVAEAAMRGCSWADIGTALGCSRQSAHQKFAPVEDWFGSFTRYLNDRRFMVHLHARNILHSPASSPAQRVEAREVYRLFRE